MRALLAAIFMTACTQSAALCVDSHDPCSPRSQCVYTNNGWRVCVCCSLALDAGWAFDIDTPACDHEPTGWEKICPPKGATP